MYICVIHQSSIYPSSYLDFLLPMLMKFSKGSLAKIKATRNISPSGAKDLSSCCQFQNNHSFTFLQIIRLGVVGNYREENLLEAASLSLWRYLKTRSIGRQRAAGAVAVPEDFLHIYRHFIILKDGMLTLQLLALWLEGISGHSVKTSQGDKQRRWNWSSHFAVNPPAKVKVYSQACHSTSHPTPLLKSRIWLYLFTPQYYDAAFTHPC